MDFLRKQNKINNDNKYILNFNLNLSYRFQRIYI